MPALAGPGGQPSGPERLRAGQRQTGQLAEAGSPREAERATVTGPLRVPRRPPPSCSRLPNGQLPHTRRTGVVIPEAQESCFHVSPGVDGPVWGLFGFSHSSLLDESLPSTFQHAKKPSTYKNDTFPGPMILDVAGCKNTGRFTLCCRRQSGGRGPTGRRTSSTREGLVSSSRLVSHLLERGTWSKRRKAGEALLTAQVNQTGTPGTSSPGVIPEGQARGQGQRSLAQVKRQGQVLLRGPECPLERSLQPIPSDSQRRRDPRQAPPILKPRSGGFARGSTRKSSLKRFTNKEARIGDQGSEQGSPVAPENQTLPASRGKAASQVGELRPGQHTSLAPSAAHTR